MLWFFQCDHDATMKILLLFLFAFFFSSANSSHPHPLDPLTPSEFKLVQTIVQKSYSNPSQNISFQYVGLDEPNKADILSWLSSNTKSKTQTLLPRRAFVIARLHKQTLEITVDLSTLSIASNNVYNGNGYPMFNMDEETIASDLPFQYKPFIESVKKRDLNIYDVVCTTFSVGWFGEKKTNRIMNILCYYMEGTANLYMRPLEGVTVVVDLDKMKIVGYNDRVQIPVPKADGTEYRALKQKPPLGPRLKGVAVRQPDGPGFHIDGHSVRYVLNEFTSVSFSNVKSIILGLIICVLNCLDSN